MDSSCGALHKFSSRMGAFLNNQKFKCIRILNLRINDSQEKFSNDKTVKEDTLITSRSKSSFEEKPQNENLKEDLKKDLKEESEDDLKYLQLNKLLPKYQKRNCESLKDSEEKLKKNNLEDLQKLNTSTKSTSKINTFTKWRSKLTRFTQELSTGTNPIVKNNEYNEGPTQTGEIKTLKLSDKIVKLNISDEEINISPKSFNQPPESVCNNDSSPFTSIETTSYNSSGEYDEVRTSNWVSFLIYKTIGFIGKKIKPKRSYRFDLSDEDFENEDGNETEESELDFISKGNFLENDFHNLKPSTSKVDKKVYKEVHIKVHKTHHPQDDQINRLLLGLKPVNSKISKKSSQDSLLDVNVEENLCRFEQTKSQVYINIENLNESSINENRKRLTTHKLTKTSKRKRWFSFYYSKLFKIQSKESVHKTVKKEIEMEVLNPQNKTLRNSTDNLVKTLEKITNNLRSPKHQHDFKCQTNGFKPLFPEESLRYPDRPEYREIIRDQNRLDRLQKLLWGDESEVCESIPKETESKEQLSSRDVCGELMDILQNIKESFNEARERREIFSLHDTKSDHTIKPLKVHREYRRKCDEKMGRKQTRSRENPDVSRPSKDFKTVETVAIVHRPPD